MLLTPVLNSLLAGLDGLGIAMLVCIIALAVALVVICVLVVVYTGKKGKEAPKDKPHPIIIYKKIPVAVKAAKPEEKAEEKAPAAAEPEEEPEEEPVPTVIGEIAAAEAAAAAAAPEEELHENAMRYDKSFRARLIQADDTIKSRYGIIKNELLSYADVSDRISWKHEGFHYKRNPVALLVIKGKTLYLYLALKAADYEGTKYQLEDVSSVAQYADTPALYRLKSEKRIRYAQDLIADLCAKLGTEKTEREPVDYYEPYNSDIVLINKGLIRRVFEDASESFIGASGFSEAQDEVTDGIAGDGDMD